MESWIVEQRRVVCMACDVKASCEKAGVFHSWFLEQTKCPKKLHPSRIDVVSARAWPEGVTPVGGCCDRMG